MPAEITLAFDVICCASGTGGTLAGIAAGLEPGQRAIGFSVLKGGEFLLEDVRRPQRDYGRQTDNWSIETEFHFGGSARRISELDAFIADFRQRHGIELDLVYVAKMMYGLFAQVERDGFAPGTVVVAVITG
jgi:1-aminocyclopropane-1-carboxylate deaminase